MKKKFIKLREIEQKYIFYLANNIFVINTLIIDSFYFGQNYPSY